MALYEEIKVWRHTGTTGTEAVKVYRCFKDRKSGKFAVQSADFFRLPLMADQIYQSDRQALELFIEQSPARRCAWFQSLEEAISAHDREFQYAAAAGTASESDCGTPTQGQR